MFISLVCPSCHFPLSVPAHAAGRVVTCPKCQKPFTCPPNPPVVPIPSPLPPPPIPPFEDIAAESGYRPRGYPRVQKVQLPMIVIVAAWVVVCLGGPVLADQVLRKTGELVRAIVAARDR